MTPEAILQVIKLVKQGKVAWPGEFYVSDVPFLGPRGWNMTIPGNPTGGPFAWKSSAAEEKAERVAKFVFGEPGIGVSACEYVAERKIILTGGDTSANDAQPVSDGSTGSSAARSLARLHR